MDSQSLLFFTAMAMSSAVPDKEADKAILNAYLNQSGIERNITRTAKKYEKQMLSPEARYWSGHIVLISKIVIDQRITIQWGF